MKKKNTQSIFKPYTQQQLLLPMKLEDIIPEKHLVRVVNQVIDEMDIEPVLKQYKGGGTSSYHPRMMLKVLIYAYTQKTFSSRSIAKAIRENINYMWLSGGNAPNFRTINRFRGKILGEVIDEVFVEVLDYMNESGYIKLENYFIDGTKIEANANRYSFVWRRSTEGYQRKLRKKVHELLEEVERVNAEEDERYGDKDIEELGDEAEIDSQGLRDLAERLNKKLKFKPKDKQLKKAVKKLARDFIPRMEKYERYEETFEGRNSFSKTDEDATFMCMKEDHMRNRKLKPGYNVQIGTEGQFVIGYSIHQKPGDSPCLIPHMEKIRAQLGRMPDKIIADAGYGSEENYAYMAENGVAAYVKFSTYDREQKKRRKIPDRETYWASNWKYDEIQDEIVCPQGKRLIYEKTRSERTDNGYLTKRRVYHCDECGNCPVRDQCTQSKYGRRAMMSVRLRQFRTLATKRLLSMEGKQLRSQRLIEAEAVFGRLKQNWGFRRFLLRGMKNVNTEWGLLCMAHNIAKLAV